MINVVEGQDESSGGKSLKPCSELRSENGGRGKDHQAALKEALRVGTLRTGKWRGEEKLVGEKQTLCIKP